MLDCVDLTLLETRLTRGVDATLALELSWGQLGFTEMTSEPSSPLWIPPSSFPFQSC